MTLASRAASMLIRSLKASNGVSITYTRSLASVTITAWVGRTVFRQNPHPERPSAAVIFGERDYLIAADDLILSGSPVIPARGDRITETIDGSAIVFEVLPPETGDPPARFADAGRTYHRVHVKRVS